MSSKAVDIYTQALNACRSLEQSFPGDDRLKLIIRGLEQWSDSQKSPALKPKRHERIHPSRIDSRFLRPLDEDVAYLVCEASKQARLQRLTA